MLTDAAPDITAFASFPQSHWRGVWSTNPLKRVKAVVKRRTDVVVGIFSNEPAIVRRRAVLIETHDEWQDRAPLLLRGLDGRHQRRRCRTVRITEEGRPCSTPDQPR